MSVPKDFGVEIDLRDRGDRLILQHDPFKDGEDFEQYLKHYRCGTIILNIKSEGIEYSVLALLKKYGIKKYFFLDSSFPMIYALTRAGHKEVALRFSEYESIETIMSMKNLAQWVWVDCFTTLPINAGNFKILKDNGFNLCLVSPELQKQAEKIQQYKACLESEKIYFDAICTKLYNVDKWAENK
ncbi:MAG: hypothetical protein H7844_10280 [Nitrospirae bacterium YQR-1]